MGEIRNGIIGDGGQDAWREAKGYGVRYGEGQPIRRCFGDGIRPDGARSAGTVFNNNTVAKGIRKGGGEKPANRVCQATRWKARNQANGLAVRPSLGARL
jgi:hypothetical protein